MRVSMWICIFFVCVSSICLTMCKQTESPILIGPALRLFIYEISQCVDDGSIAILCPLAIC